MKGEKLYHFLNSLNQAEKNQCTRFLLPGGKRLSKYALLYKTLIEQGDYDEQRTLVQLYGLQEHNMRRFEATCDYLGGLIIQALASKDDKINSLLPVIRKAREKGLIRLAGKHLQKAVKAAGQQEDFEELLPLFQERQILKTQYGYVVNLRTAGINRAEIFQSLVQLEQLHALLEEFRTAKWKVSKGKANGKLASLKERLNRLEIHSQREKYQQLRLQMRLCYVEQKFDEACDLQEEIMDLVYNSGIPRIEDNRIEESGRMLRMYHYVARFEAADLELMRLRAAPVYSHFDKAHYWRHILTAGFVSAFTLGKIDMGKAALAELGTMKELIPQEFLAKLYYYAALFLTMNNQWKEARPYLQSIQKLPAKARKLFTWQPEMLMALGYIEMEEPDMATMVLDRIQRKNKGQAYPIALAKGLERILYAAPKESGLLLANLRSRLEELKDHPENYHESLYFDVALWIDARLQQKTMIDISRSQKFEWARQAFSGV